MVAPLALMGLSAVADLVGNVASSVGSALAPKPDATQGARNTAQDFEGMFLENTLERLTQSDATEGPLGENGIGGGVYRSMLVKQYAGQITKSGGVGIADQVYRQILQMQEAAGKAGDGAHG